MHWESCELSAGVLRWLISSLATELLCQPQGIVPMWPWEAGAGGASSLFPFTSSVRLGLGTAPCGLALSSGSVRPFYCWGGAAARQDAGPSPCSLASVQPLSWESWATSLLFTHSMSRSAMPACPQGPQPHCCSRSCCFPSSSNSHL